jgi:glycosyltransferase involved in cell wall biosynthesis
MESVDRQTYENIEHVIVDGGSEDGTTDIVKEYPLGYFISEKDKGVYDAMDKGANVSKGDLLIFLNAGDTFYDNFVCEDVVLYFLKTGADIVFGNLMPVYLKATDSHDHRAFVAGKMVNLGYIKNRRQLYDESIHHQTTFYRRWIFNKCSFICSSHIASGEYNVLLCAAMIHNASIKFLDRPISRFVLGGISTKDFSTEWKKYVEARDELRAIYCPEREMIKIKNESEFIPIETHSLKDKIAFKTNKSKLKRLIKRSPFFKVYEKVANSLALRFYNLVVPTFENIQERHTQRLFNDFSITIEKILFEINKRFSDIQEILKQNEKNLRYQELENERLIQSINHLKINSVKILKNFQHKDSFNENGYSVFSQWDEDGLIQFLLHRIDNIKKKFIEIGVGDYSEANTRLLLEKDHWSGIIIDCNKMDIEKVKASEMYWKCNLNAIDAFVNCDNVNQLITDNNLTGEIGLLSIDIDGIDYWIWDAITVISPIIVICEYNGIFGSKSKVTVPYEKRFDRREKHYSCLYAGASLGALKEVGIKKGYTLIGTNAGGNNAFFVRNDILQMSQIKPSEKTFKKPVFRESRNPDGSLSYLDISEGIKLIYDLPVYDIENDRNIKIRDIYLSYNN